MRAPRPLAYLMAQTASSLDFVALSVNEVARTDLRRAPWADTAQTDSLGAGQGQDHPNANSRPTHVTRKDRRSLRATVTRMEVRRGVDANACMAPRPGRPIADATGPAIAGWASKRELGQPLCPWATIAFNATPSSSQAPQVCAAGEQPSIVRFALISADDTSPALRAQVDTGPQSSAPALRRLLRFFSGCLRMFYFVYMYMQTAHTRQKLGYSLRRDEP